MICSWECGNMALNNYQDADFTPDITPSDVRPNMGTYNSPQTFRFWCQKVLPLVYDDSLSYYELLCKVVDYLNKTMEDVDTAVQDVENLNTAFGSLENHVNASETALLQAYNDLQDYVNTYFNNLDVQEEINNKLDTMAEDGTLDELLLPYFNEYTEATNQIINNRFTQQDAVLNTQNGRIGVLESRMDTFASLQEGSTTGDAELIDIRVDAYGATYPSAGDSVRGQVDALTEDTTSTQNLVFGKHKVRNGWVKGVYEANGWSALTNANYAHGNILPAGTYIVTPASGYYCEAYAYVDDTTGTKIDGMNSNTKHIDSDSPFVLSVRKNPTDAISDAERLALNDVITVIEITNGHTINRDIILTSGIVFFYGTQKPSITKNSDNTYTVIIPDNPRGYYTNNGEFNPIVNSGTAQTLTLTVGNYLVYDITTNEFLVLNYQGINTTDDNLVIVLVNQNGNLYGQWTRYLAQEQNDDSDALPTYYDNYLPTKLSQIRNYIASAGNDGVSFVFISDVHYDAAEVNNMRISPLLIKAVSEETPVKRMICGGDLITSANSKDDALKLIQETITDYRTKTEMDTLWTVGNHEFNNPDANPELSSKQLTIGEVYPFITQGNYEIITLSNSTGAYYADDHKNKIRYLFTACNYDSSVNTDSIEWLIEQLPSTPTDYDIILISHLGIYYNSTLESYTGAVDDFKPMLQALQAYKWHTTFTYDGTTYDFSSKTGTVLGAFLGHYHVDGQNVWYNIPCCMITTDSLNENPHSSLTRTAGTISEQAFDVVTVDRSNGSIYCTRIGAGNDRQFVNGAWSVS